MSHTFDHLFEKVIIKLHFGKLSKNSVDFNFEPPLFFLPENTLSLLWNMQNVTRESATLELLTLNNNHLYFVASGIFY